jgi:hypothetical protein
MEIEITEKTAFTHSHYGWEGSTFMKINGFLYEVSTMKRHNNEIMSIAQKLSSRTRGNSFSSVQYTPSQDKAVIILREKAVATEAKIRELHARALEMIPALNDQFPTVPADAPYIPHVGHLIFVDGYGTEDQLMAIYEIKDNMAFYVNTKTLQLGRHELFSIRDYAKKFGIGVYHRQGQAIALDKIQELVITAKAKAKKDVEERPTREAAAKALLEKQMAEIEAQYPWLIKPTKDSYAGKHVAVNLRIEFKRAFPKIKFSVTSNFDSVDISWNDGPTIDQVQKYSAKWEDHKTDETGDFRDHAPSTFNKVFDGCKYVFEQRHMSPETRTRLDTWAGEMFAKDETFGTHDKDNLAYRLFRGYEIPQSEWKITRTDADSGLNSPEVFWQIAPVSPSSGSQTLEAASATYPLPLALANGTLTVSRNTEKGGIEIRFPKKPDQSLLDDLKAHGFHWSGFAKCWWTKYSPDTWDYANKLAS